MIRSHEMNPRLPRVEWKESAVTRQDCRGKLRGCGEFRQGREIGCRIVVDIGRLQGRG